MKKQTFILVVILQTWALAIHSQVITLEGKIIDNTTQKGIPYVNVGFPKYSIGTSSNESGDFIIKIQKEKLQDTLVFSCIGYTTFKVVANDFLQQKKDKSIALKSSEVNLSEFVVKSLDAKKIIKKVLKNRNDNYATTPSLMQFFCRESMKNRDSKQYFSQSEGILEMYKASVKSNNDRVRLVKGRKKNLNAKYEYHDTLFVIPEVVNAPNAGIILDIMKSPEFFMMQNNQFKFMHNGYDRINDRLAYVLYFSPKDTTQRFLQNGELDFYEGKIYVDTLTYALVRADFQLSKRGIRVTNIQLNRINSPLRMVKRTFIVDYTEFNNKWYFKSSNVENNYFFPDADLHLVHKMENFVTEIKTDKFKEITDAEVIKTDESLGQKIAYFDDSFWEDYNFIKSSEVKKD
jgi:hypothetical protein